MTIQVVKGFQMKQIQRNDFWPGSAIQKSGFTV